jgi:OOP family OmpA-OmpF porin
MKNSIYLRGLISAFAVTASGLVLAQTVNPNNPGYLIGASGSQIVKSGTNLCWRTGSFTPANAIAGCDDDLLPKAAPPAPAPTPAPAPARPAAAAPAPAPVEPKAAEMAPRAAPAPAPAVVAPPPVPAAAPSPRPTSEKVSFAADTFFDFDKTVVKPEGKAKLDTLIGQIKGIALEVVIAVGHTDSVGSDKYNDRLSQRRADSVKAYLVSKGIEPNRIYTEGKGEKQPVASNKTPEGRAKNRRVEIEVVGTRPTK